MPEPVLRRCARSGCHNFRPIGRSFRYCQTSCRMVAKREQTKAAQARHHERNPTARRDAHVKSRNGITWEQYEAMLEAQGGRCAICRTDNPRGRGRWHIDHDRRCCPGRRSCGECVRALLCSTCNGWLLPALESPHIEAALAYLDRW